MSMLSEKIKKKLFDIAVYTFVAALVVFYLWFTCKYDIFQTT